MRLISDSVRARRLQHLAINMDDLQTWRNEQLQLIEATVRGSAELRQRMVCDIGTFTIALFAVYDSKEGDVLELAGTGTLVAVAGSHFILTAAHVWKKKLKSAAKMGITLPAEINHRYLIDIQCIVPVGPEAPPIWNEWGPDIILLQVPAEYVGEIKARRDFYEAAVDGNMSVTVDCLETHVLMGTPEASGKFTRTHADVEINGILPLNVKSYIEREGFDYSDLEIDISTAGAPESFGGVSGGGLWKILVYQSQESGKIEWRRSLEGVAFYQSDAKDGNRIVRCHGPKSIAVVNSLLTKQESPA